MNVKATIMKYLHYLVIIGFIVSALLMSGCQISSKLAESRLKSILASEVSCTAPCWRSLQPGLSTEKDFMNLVNAPGSYSFNDVKSVGLNPEGTEYTWDDKEYNTFNRVRIYKDQVKLLGFQLMNNNTTPWMATELYGQPDAYGAFILGSHDFYLILSLIYENEGIVIEADFPIDREQLEVVTVTCTFEIDWDRIPKRLYSYLVEPGVAEEMVRNDPIGGFNNPSHKPQPWESKNPLILTQCP